MRLTVFGVGYVGLVTGTGLADLGHDVLCVDTDERRIDALATGALPFYEPGLDALVRRGTRSGRLHFASRVTEPFDASDVYFIAVGTPATPDGRADLTAVFDVARTLAETARNEALVAIKSTVPVGTADRLQRALAVAAVPLEVVSNPEFLKEGAAVEDFFRPDRVVLGVESEGAFERLRALYGPLQLLGERVVRMDRRSAELTKYASNALLAMRVSFMNELSRLCHATGADIHSVRMGAGADSRIGRRFLHAGPGYGGSCFPKDVRALVAMGEAAGVRLRLAEATHLANEEQGDFLFRLVEDAFGGLAGKTVALWGLAFKPETDDVRESPALRLATRLADAGANVVGHDPEAGATFLRAMAGGARVVERDYDALDGAHGLVLLTEWRAYRAPDFHEIARRLRAAGPRPPAVVDGRNLWNRSDVVAAGLRYVGVGVPAAAPRSKSRAPRSGTRIRTADSIEGVTPCAGS